MDNENDVVATISADTPREAPLPPPAFNCPSCGAVVRSACDCASRTGVHGKSQYGEWHEDLWTLDRP